MKPKISEEIVGVSIILTIFLVIVLGFGMLYYQIIYGDVSCAFKTCVIVKGEKE